MIKLHLEVPWSILEEKSYSCPMGDIIKTEVLKMDRKDFSQALERFDILSTLITGFISFRLFMILYISIHLLHRNALI